MRNFCVDVETLGTESTAVILSAALIPFELNEKPVYEELLERAIFVKFDVEQQLRELHRTAEQSTMEWWQKQCDLVKDKSFKKDKKRDVDAATGLTYLKNKAELSLIAKENKDVIFWSRGSLDQVTIDSLSKQVHNELVIPFNNWRDVRTAVDLLCEGASGGYCAVTGFNRDIVLKHDPVADCAYDIMMLLANNRV